MCTINDDFSFPNDGSVQCRGRDTGNGCVSLTSKVMKKISNEIKRM